VENIQLDIDVPDPIFLGHSSQPSQQPPGFNNFSPHGMNYQIRRELGTPGNNNVIIQNFQFNCNDIIMKSKYKVYK